jgi:hypothetical protein
MTRTPCLVAACLITGLAWTQTAAAQSRPLLAPAHDAVVDYQLDAARTDGSAREMRMYIAAGGQHVRVEPKDGRAIIILDRAAHKSIVVMTERHMYMERALDSDPGRDPVQEFENAKLERKGTKTIAGRTCTVWQVQNPKQSTACITDDGLILQGSGRGDDGQMHTTLTATAVQITRIDPSMFHPPAGYAAFQMPQIPGMPAGMPGRPMPPGMQLPPGVTVPKP